MKLVLGLWTVGGIGYSFTISATDISNSPWNIRGVRGVGEALGSLLCGGPHNFLSPRLHLLPLSVLIILREWEYIFSGFGCGNRGALLVWGSHVFRAKKVKLAKRLRASVSGGVGVPSAALEKKVHVQNGSSCRRFPPAAGKPPKCSLRKPDALSWSLSIWFHSPVEALALSRKSHWGRVCDETRVHVEGGFFLVMRCGISNRFRTIGIWLILLAYKCHHKVCVYFCVCVIRLFIYFWETWIL